MGACGEVGLGWTQRGLVQESASANSLIVGGALPSSLSPPHGICGPVPLLLTRFVPMTSSLLFREIPFRCTTVQVLHVYHDSQDDVSTTYIDPAGDLTTKKRFTIPQSE